MNKYGSQYGEEYLLGLIFNGQETGMVVDVGAADGYDNSNSYCLLQRPGWNGVLIEPEPSQFLALQKRYADRHGVVCVQTAIGQTEGPRTLHCGLQVSTFDEMFKKRIEEKYRVVYHDVQVDMVRLDTLLKRLKIWQSIEFLSIDAEGMDMEVWESLCGHSPLPKVVCLEGGAEYQLEGYVQFCFTTGNVFFLREDICDQL